MCSYSSDNFHDTEHQKVVEQHVSQKLSKFNNFVVSSHLLKGEVSKHLLLS